MDGADRAARATPLVSDLLSEDPGLRDVVADFIASLPERVSELERAYRVANWEQLQTLAHQLKGAGGSYGYPDISRLGAEMEQQFRRQSAERFAAQVQALKGLAAAARAGLLAC